MDSNPETNFNKFAPLKCLFLPVFWKTFYTYVLADLQNKCNYERGAQLLQKPRSHLKNSVCLKCDMIQVLCWWPTNIRCHHTKFCRHSKLAPRICAPQHYKYRSSLSATHNLKLRPSLNSNKHSINLTQPQKTYLLNFICYIASNTNSNIYQHKFKTV